MTRNNLSLTQGEGSVAIAFALTLCLLPACLAQTLAPLSTGSLTLDQAVAAALATNPSMRAAAQQLAQAQARIGQAQAGKRFQITFNSTASGSNVRVIQPPPSQETFGTLQNTVTIPLPVGQKPGLAIRQAQEQFAAAQAQYRSVRFSLAGQVAGDYFDLLRRQALQTAAQQTLDQAQIQLTATQKRERAGDVAQLDVLQAQVPVLTAQASLARAASDVTVSQQTLNDAIGNSFDAPFPIADVTTTPNASVVTSVYTLEQVRTLAVQNSADVYAADANIRAQQAALAVAELYREPAFSLQAIDIHSNDQTSFSRQDTIQAGVTLPLSDGGLGREQVREARAVLAQALALAEATRKTARATASTAYLTAQGARAQVAAAQAAQNLAQTTYDKTVRGYQNGLFPLLNVLNAQNALAQARTAYVQAIYDAAASANALQAAITGGVTVSGPSANQTYVGPNAAGANTPGAGGTSPAGAGGPNTSPSGSSTTGPSAGGTNAGGRGAP